MRIADSTVQFTSFHEYAASATRRESVRFWVNPSGAGTESSASGGVAGSNEREVRQAASESGWMGLWAARQGGGHAVNVGGLTAAQNAPLRTRATAGDGPCKGAAAAGADELAEDAALDPKLGMLKLLLEKLFGVHIRVSPQVQVQAPSPAQAAAPQEDTAGQLTAGQSAPQGWGLEVNVQERQYEAESTRFSTAGMVQTSDGRQIQFTLNLQMDCEYLHEDSITFRAGDAARDPLVVNFGGTAAQLTDTAFSFDLEGDGQAEEVPLLAPGSGFLALDRNGDGRIADGTELFGPSSGDGFAELARLDSDGNQWIDENDPAYDQLRIWRPGANGAGAIATLRDQQVGAIYLGHADTPFALRTADNQPQGQITASGIYLNEDGTAGSIQQLDLSV
jgi:hypothetical protein